MVYEGFSEKEIATAKQQKEMLCRDIIFQETVVYHGLSIAYDVISNTASALKSILGDDTRVSSFFAMHYMRMSEGIPQAFRPLMAIIEQYDTPRMHMLEDDVCIEGIDEALTYATIHNIQHLDTFLKGLSTYYAKIIQREPKGSYRAKEFSKAIEHIGSILPQYEHTHDKGA